MPEEERPKPEPTATTPLGPLPPGRHTLSREDVSRSQRERLIAGFTHVVAERGYNQTTLADIAKAAAVSRRTFYENFADKEECFLAAFDLFSEHVTAGMAAAASDQPDWPHQVIAAIGALLEELSAAPDFARLCFLEATAAGPQAGLRYREALLSFVPLLQQGRAERDPDSRMSEATEVAVLGGTAALLASRINAGKLSELPQLLPNLAEFVLTPYLGGDEAGQLARQLS